MVEKYLSEADERRVGGGGSPSSLRLMCGEPPPSV
jgi:hypothetical protein